MGRAAREQMDQARVSLDARKAKHGSLKNTKPCHAIHNDVTREWCGNPTTKTVIWPGIRPIPACSLPCAVVLAGLAGEDRFYTVRWG